VAWEMRDVHRIADQTKADTQLPLMYRAGMYYWCTKWYRRV